MKTACTFMMAFLALAANAQFIPNANFENWTSNTWTDNPDNWITGNSQVLEPVTQDLDAYEGDFAMTVTSQQTGSGEYASAYSSFDVQIIPSTLNFYVKTEASFGSVSVVITFNNLGEQVQSYNWTTSDNIEDWTPITIGLISTGPAVTDCKIEVITQVGDLVDGDAIISIDALSFGNSTGIDKIENHSIKVFPNPANDVIGISASDLEIESISIMDITGRVVIQRSQLKNGQQIEISDLPEGIYILSARIADGTVSTQKFLVSR